MFLYVFLILLVVDILLTAFTLITFKAKGADFQQSVFEVLNQKRKLRLEKKFKNKKEQKAVENV